MKSKEELSKIRDEYKDIAYKLKKLSKEELEYVTGGVEPEEFDWKSKGYQTPIKEEDDDGSFKFEAIGDKHK